MGNWVVVGNGRSSDPVDHLAERGMDLVRFLTPVLDAIEDEDKH
jgi:hypothetical protein